MNIKQKDSPKLFSLLLTRRFYPIFIAQFFNAFNDNVLKNAMIMLVTYKLAVGHGGVWVNVMGACFIMPFFLFSAYAGLLADQVDKAVLARWVKFFEILVCLLGALSLGSSNIYFFLCVLFLTGTLSTFFGPIKYAVLPQHVHEHELVSANALIESSTFLAILIGTVIGGWLSMHGYGLHIISVVVMLAAVIGWLASLFLLPAPSHTRKKEVDLNFFRLTGSLIRTTKRQQAIFMAIMGISWFWLVGVIFLTQVPNFNKLYIGGGGQLATYFLTVFALGVGIGSLLCNKLLKGEVSTKYVPLALMLMSFFIADLYFATHHHSVDLDAAKIGLSQFMLQWHGWRISLDLLFAAVFGGIYTVPLYAFIQHHSSEQFRSRTIACNNIMNALFMALGLVVTGVLLFMDVPLVSIFAMLAVANFLVSLYIFRLIPEAFVKVLFKWVLQKCFHVTVSGLEHYHALGKKAIIVANHTSFLDAALLAAFLPDRVFFAINTHMAKRWWMKIVLHFADTFTVDPGAPMSMKVIIKQVNKNRKCIIFPEGRITVTGSLMKVYEGPGVIADKTGAPLLPIRIDGAQYSYFSRMRHKNKLRLFPRISLTILPPQKLSCDASSSRLRRKQMGQQLYEVMVNLMVESVNFDQTLLQRLFEMQSLKGGKKIVYEDPKRAPIDYNTLILQASVLADVLGRRTCFKERVGVLLPTLNITMVLFFALQLRHRIPAMLNFTAGSKSLLSACKTAVITQVVSSREFVEKARLVPLVDQLIEDGLKVMWLEDLPSSIGLLTKIRGYLRARLPALFQYPEIKTISPTDPAVVLFTSGSEGSPKAVQLSHRNIIANVTQVIACSDFNPSDIIFNFLPVFHSFGLTAGALLPVLTGVRAFLYPNPLHFRVIPELVYDTNATIMFATNTFLNGFAKYAHPYDFYSIRSIYAGAEKLKRSTEKLWLEEYGVRIFEGYGVTETSPIIAVNTALSHRKGSVGKLLPTMLYRLEPVEGIEKGGRLFVKGPNVMLGYIDPSDHNKTIRPPQGWHDTGDIVAFDEDGFMYILGRAKRFAKISGEMVSLSSVEAYIEKLWPDHQHAVVSVQDERKGERLVLFTTYPDPDLKVIIDYVHQHGIPDLTVPKVIHVVDALPALGTGKVDYVALDKLAQSDTARDDSSSDGPVDA